MKTIQLVSSIRQNSTAAKLLGHKGKDFNKGAYIDIIDSVPRVLRALKVEFEELEYYSYDLIQLRNKQIPVNPHMVYLNKPNKATKPKTLVYKAESDPAYVKEVVTRLLKTMQPCLNCGDFTPRPTRLQQDGSYYHRDMYCNPCARISAP